MLQLYQDKNKLHFNEILDFYSGNSLNQQSMHEWAYLFTQDTLSQLGANPSLFLLLYCACLVEYKYKLSSLFHLTCSSPRSITLKVSNFYFKYCFQLSNTFSILRRPKTRKIYDSVSYWPIAVDKCPKKKSRMWN